MEQSQGVNIVSQRGRDDVCCMCFHQGESQFTVLGGQQQKLYTIKEDKDLCCRQCACLCQRDFDYNVVDEKTNNKAFVMTKKTMCCTCFTCFACCRHRISIKDANGPYIGTVQNDCRICCTCWPKYSATDSKGEPVFRAVKDISCCGACCGAYHTCCCIQCSIPSNYDILTTSGKGELDVLGSRGTNESYLIQFPPETSVNAKFLMIACALLIGAKQDASEPKSQKMK